ncbi:MAG: polysaccharide deacetylase family protein [Bacteroidales bacterium]|jgi:hypothetical protein|nr:polysaccharide deacetylase family protein [Bacteroidales bacterium]
MKPDVQVYTNKRSSRLEYAVDLVLGNILGLEYIITSTPLEGIPLINYSYDRSVGGIFIQPEGLLFEEGIRTQEIWVAHLNGIPLFFQQPPEAGFQLDIFSFAFYMVSRYEEYLPQARDEYGRFAVESSLAYKNDFLDIPVVDIWARRLGATLSLLYPGLEIPEKKFSYLLTLDVEEAFAFRGKGLMHNLAGLLGDMMRGINPGKRVACMTGRIRDEYDTYTYINETSERYGCPLLYFFAAGNNSGLRKKVSSGRRCYRKLVKRLGERYEIGLRTSYSYDNVAKLIEKEKATLESITAGKILKLRKHHLLMTLPESYHLIQELGIERDYSMGYIREAGFRAGIARPFKFYDLSREEISSLQIVPYQFMDLTFQKYKRYEPGEALKSINKLIQGTKEVGGLFVSIWHNSSLTNLYEWEGWKEIFEYTLYEQQNIK